jgi:hypothetical protein
MKVSQIVREAADLSEKIKQRLEAQKSPEIVKKALGKAMNAYADAFDEFHSKLEKIVEDLYRDLYPLGGEATHQGKTKAMSLVTKMMAGFMHKPEEIFTLSAEPAWRATGSIGSITRLLRTL